MTGDVIVSDISYKQIKSFAFKIWLLFTATVLLIFKYCNFFLKFNITVKMSAVLEYIPVDGKVNIIFFPLQKCKRANWKMA